MTLIDTYDHHYICSSICMIIVTHHNLVILDIHEEHQDMFLRYFSGLLTFLSFQDDTSLGSVKHWEQKNQVLGHGSFSGYDFNGDFHGSKKQRLSFGSSRTNVMGSINIYVVIYGFEWTKMDENVFICKNPEWIRKKAISSAAKKKDSAISSGKKGC